MTEKHERIPLDAYTTPKPLADWIVRHAVALLAPDAREHFGGYVPQLCEPGCGDAAPFSRAARDLGLLAIGCDMREVNPFPNSPEDVGGIPSWQFARGDFLADDFKSLFSSEIFATNPPFKDALPFVERMLDSVNPNGVVAVLVRLAFLAGLKRNKLFRSRPPVEVWVCSRRPSFAHGGTDPAQEYAAIFWVGPARHRLLAALGRGELRTEWLDDATLNDQTALDDAIRAMR